MSTAIGTWLALTAAPAGGMSRRLRMAAWPLSQEDAGRTASRTARLPL